METYLQTDIGNVRDNNEDSINIFEKDDTLLAVVADGMGGHQDGKKASQMAMAVIEEAWRLSKRMKQPIQAEEWMKEVAQEANRTIHQYAKENQAEGMGTTIVMAICTDSFATIGHAGDSRCYLSNTNGFQQLTEDHSYVNLLVKVGKITKKQAEFHPKKSVIIRSLGPEEKVEIDIQSIAFETGDTLLLCSDGLYSKIEPQILSNLLVWKDSLAAKAERLIALAKENGGEDNISLILVQQSDIESEENKHD